MTAREAILQAVFAILDAVPNAKAYRSREAEVSQSEGTVINLKPEDEQLELRTAGTDLVVRTLTILVTVYAVGDIPDSLVDTVIERLHADLMRDRTLGGLCALIFEHSTKFDFENGNGTGAAIEIRYSIRYQTSAANFSAIA